MNLRVFPVCTDVLLVMFTGTTPIAEFYAPEPNGREARLLTEVACERGGRAFIASERVSGPMPREFSFAGAVRSECAYWRRQAGELFVHPDDCLLDL